MHVEREHHEYSPSQSERFFLCEGSVNLLRRTANRVPSPYALEGTIAHEVLEAGLTNRCANATQAISESIHFESEFDDEFKSCINDALDYVWNLLDELNAKYGDAELYVERKVVPPTENMPGEAAGYCDIAIYSAKARQLWVIDYKHGVGIAKAVIGNTQVKQYAAGFLFEDNPAVDPANVDMVTLVIIQPRAFHPDGEIREYITTPAALFDYLMELDEKIEACEKISAPLTPGIDQCRFCEARSTCPAVEETALASINSAFRSVRDVTQTMLPDPKSLDINRLAYAMNVASMVSLWLKAVESHVEELLRSGVDVPGWKMVETKASRKYYGDHTELAKQISALAGVPIEEVYPHKLISITDAQQLVVDAFKARASRGKKKIAAEEAKKMFAFFTLKQSSGNVTLVSADDPRPATNKAALSFNNVPLLPPPTN